MSLKQKLKSALPPALLNLRYIFGAQLAYAPGNFYSPICSRSDLDRYYRDPRGDAPKTIHGIDLNAQDQRDLWISWSQYLREIPFPETRGDFRYFYNNRAYGIGDATVLYCMLRHLKPRRLIEVGSGYSSACSLDTIEHFLDGKTRCTFIEPYPALLRSLTKCQFFQPEIIPHPVQDVPLVLFDELDAGDILFIDSTHILKTGSDVAHELFEILPRLKPGVVIHFHDMFYPFEYPREWVIEQNYSWNEIYAVRAFLMNSAAFRILFFNDHFARVSSDLIKKDAPRMMRNTGGALWLQKF